MLKSPELIILQLRYKFPAFVSAILCSQNTTIHNKDIKAKRLEPELEASFVAKDFKGVDDGGLVRSVAELGAVLSVVVVVGVLDAVIPGEAFELEGDEGRATVTMFVVDYSVSFNSQQTKSICLPDLCQSLIESYHTRNSRTCWKGLLHFRSTICCHDKSKNSPKSGC